jgi:hypothetical protein
VVYEEGLAEGLCYGCLISMMPRKGAMGVELPEVVARRVLSHESMREKVSQYILEDDDDA